MYAKRIVSVLGGALVLTASIAAFAGVNDGPAGQAAPAVPIGSLNANQGAILCTAQINADGTSAGGPSSQVASSQQLAAFPGAYEVLFKGACPNVTAAKGWARIVQPDTLTINNIAPGTSCTTADRVGAINGVFVYCANAAGTPTNTSFFLFVLR